MNYDMMSDEDIIRDIAQRVERLRISHQIKESSICEATGISQKTLYNFKKGATGFSLRYFIRLLRSIDEIDRLQLMFPETDEYRPRGGNSSELAKRVRDKRSVDRGFVWGDEK